MQKDIRLYVVYEGKRVLSGILGPDKIFRKRVELRQKLFCLDAYGIDEENVRKLQALGCQAIQLTERDTGRIYTVDFGVFRAKAVPRKLGRFGLRFYLPLRYWQEVAKTA